jgi:hypothetical protein
LLHAPSELELSGWKVRRTLVGLALLVAGVLGAYLGLMGMTSEGSAGDGAAFVTIVTVGASVAIGYFGLRYLLLGIRGKGVVIYESAVEAEFHKGLNPLPRRRTVPLLQFRISGSERLTYGQAITTTGHAFRLPPTMVEQADIWYLGSLGRRPITPGGSEARERYERGEIGPYSHPVSDPLPDHGQAWPDPGTLPITVDVPVEPEPDVSPEGPAAPAEGATVSAPTRSIVPPPVVVDVSPRPPPSVVPVAPHVSVPEPEMEVVMDLPDVVPPPETPRVHLPPPPRYKPRTESVPQPPAHKEMERGEDLPDEPPTIPVPPKEPEPELEQIPAPELEQPPEPSPPTPVEASDDWELEELPPPEEKKKRPASSSGWDWEEL